ncbi:ATP-grasp fold amidoligase family protein [Vibrio parahaemolyticus]|uniref:ATP-grasp fold amidoligase family protein n=3 Tax=Vibrio harveyi group TaxID=717610 RepID=UPI0023EABC3E|nr:hypothetical protein [Vibrio alginolyticus]ELC3207686.1 glycosyltransferase [Vibrio parahaemolyticus]MDF4305525.1 ATP-grasp fold amidoligase family protein [Vibrio parahaemolyticus]MDF5050295.1 ATP-grasp fold amidoligase family protein [Vibrio parahaemolyticus]MDF5071142.1 ATP-grasp fold amidoligase family protein [Vibrio parahaemolyticus]
MKVKQYIYKKLESIPFNLGLKIKFKRAHGYDLNFDTFNGKIQRRKLKGKNRLFSLCSCKFTVREYVKYKIGEKYLIPLLYISDKISEEDIKDLNQSAVIKATHNSGPVYIYDQDRENAAEIARSLNEQVKNDYGKASYEKWYSDINPLILAEEKLVKKDGSIPEDYKFHVFNQGNDDFVIFVQVDFERHKDHNRTIYDVDLNIIDTDICYKNKKVILQKPEGFSEMIDVVKKLASDFSYVRVDLYNVDGAVFFGELTFAHGSGFEKFSNIEYDILFGKLWKLND